MRREGGTGNLVDVARINEREKMGNLVVIAFPSKEGSVKFMPMHSLA